MNLISTVFLAVGFYPPADARAAVEGPSRRPFVLSSRDARIVLLDKKENEEKEKKQKPRFTISKETTYLTEPLDKDGYIDYRAALNKLLSKGVRPETNANVLLWKAIGPKP